MRKETENKSKFDLTKMEAGLERAMQDSWANHTEYELDGLQHNDTDTET